MTKSTENKALMIWDEKQDAIKEAYGKDLTKNEFTMFMEMGKALQLNPFNREIWAVKYGNKVSIFVGRDGYRINAQKQPDYDGHVKAAIYQNDVFEVIDGKVHHKFNLTDRGAIIGAYCEVYRKGITYPLREIVYFEEYYKGQKNPDGTIKQAYNRYEKKYLPMKPTNWDTMEATMIQKVAEAQTLRMAYQGVFGGTYSDAENWIPEGEEVPQKPGTTKPPQKPATASKNQKPATVSIDKNKVQEAEIVSETPAVQQTPAEKATAAFLDMMHQVEKATEQRAGDTSIFYNALGAEGYLGANEVPAAKRKAIYKLVYNKMAEIQKDGLILTEEK